MELSGEMRASGRDAAAQLLHLNEQLRKRDREVAELEARLATAAKQQDDLRCVHKSQLVAMSADLEMLRATKKSLLEELAASDAQREREQSERHMDNLERVKQMAVMHRARLQEEIAAKMAAETRLSDALDSVNSLTDRVTSLEDQLQRAIAPGLDVALRLERQQYWSARSEIYGVDCRDIDVVAKGEQSLRASNIKARPSRMEVISGPLNATLRAMENSVGSLKQRSDRGCDRGPRITVAAPAHAGLRQKCHL